MLATASASWAVKDRLLTNSLLGNDRGALGSPRIFVDRDFMYFGNDQLPLVRQRLS